jgi:hypothetical protein
MMRTKLMLTLIISLMAANAMANLVSDSDFMQYDVSGPGPVYGYTGFRYGTELPVGGTDTPWVSTSYGAIMRFDNQFANATYPETGSNGDTQYASNWGGSIGQVINGLVAGQEYQLSMYLSDMEGDWLTPYVETAADQGNGHGVGYLLAQQVNSFDADSDGDDEWELHTWTFLATSSDPALMRLWNNYGASVFIDDVSIIAAPLSPTPWNGAVDVPIDQVLSWTAYFDPNVPGTYTVDSYDVYMTDVFDPDPNFTGVTAANETGLTHAPTLAWSTDYAWRVDTNISEYAGPISGNVKTFTTASSVPVITEFDNEITTSALLPADLAATVTDLDTNLAGVIWQVVVDDIYPAGATASVTDTSGGDFYAPTATFTTDTEGIYFVKLTVWDAAGNSAVRLAQIDVYDDACLAASVTPGFAYNGYDLNYNCIVDLSDFAQFALAWMDDRTLDTQATGWVFGPVPVINGVPNGNLETGTVDGWISATWGSTSITNVGADVYEGSFAATFDSNNQGATTGALALPVGTGHTITFRYKGDIATVATGFDAISTAGITITSPVVISGPVASYTLYTVTFDVTTEGAGYFFVWASDGLGGNGYVDDVRLNLAP